MPGVRRLAACTYRITLDLVRHRNESRQVGSQLQRSSGTTPHDALAKHRLVGCCGGMALWREPVGAAAALAVVLGAWCATSTACAKWAGAASRWRHACHTGDRYVHEQHAVRQRCLFAGSHWLLKCPQPSINQTSKHSQVRQKAGCMPLRGRSSRAAAAAVGGTRWAAGGLAGRTGRFGGSRLGAVSHSLTCDLRGEAQQ